MADEGERDDDWRCEDDLGSLPGCLQSRRIERPVVPEPGEDAPPPRQ